MLDGDKRSLSRPVSLKKEERRARREFIYAVSNHAVREGLNKRMHHAKERLWAKSSTRVPPDVITNGNNNDTMASPLPLLLVDRACSMLIYFSRSATTRAPTRECKIHSSLPSHPSPVLGDVDGAWTIPRRARIDSSEGSGTTRKNRVRIITIERSRSISERTSRRSLSKASPDETAGDNW